MEWLPENTIFLTHYFFRERGCFRCGQHQYSSRRAGHRLWNTDRDILYQFDTSRVTPEDHILL
jgi:hypothetical protein